MNSMTCASQNTHKVFYLTFFTIVCLHCTHEIHPEAFKFVKKENVLVTLEIGV